METEVCGQRAPLFVAARYHNIPKSQMSYLHLEVVTVDCEQRPQGFISHKSRILSGQMVTISLPQSAASQKTMLNTIKPFLFYSKKDNLVMFVQTYTAYNHHCYYPQNLLSLSIICASLKPHFSKRPFIIIASCPGYHVLCNQSIITHKYTNTLLTYTISHTYIILHTYIISLTYTISNTYTNTLLAYTISLTYTFSYIYIISRTYTISLT